MNKSIVLTLLGALLVVGVMHPGWTQATKPTNPTTQPTPSMQEQYDKLHGTTPKKTTTQPSKPKTIKPQTTQKPTKATSAPKPQVAEKPKPAPKADGGSKFSVGLRGGANYCTFAAPETAGATVKPILGYHGGLILNLGSEKFSVQPEILYSQIGAKVTAVQANVDLSATAITNTITVPVLLKVGFGGENFKFFVNAGGYGSYALNGNAKLTFNGVNSTEKIKFESGDSRIEYGAVGGAGISLGLGAAKLLIEGRYYYGLGNDDKDTPKADKALYRNIQGSIGILIPLGGK
jgi:hypothetical protein